MRLHTAGTARGFGKPIVARITLEPLPAGERKDAAHEVVKVLKTLPEADLIKHLKPPRLQTYGNSIAEGVAWLSEVEQQHLPSKAVPRTLH